MCISLPADPSVKLPQATLDEGLWTQVSGTKEQVTFGKDGLLMKLDQQHASIVFEGKAK
jgi:hypothetical protein